jgi:hypothetical protein
MDLTKLKSVKQSVCYDCCNIKANMYSAKICTDCRNKSRREKYKNNEELRQKMIKSATEHKHKKVVERQHIRNQQMLEIGLENKKCRYCDEIKHKDRFRRNRMKCRDCERDEPVEKFKRYIRTRIYNCLRNHNKKEHSVDYLGCSSKEYFEWIFAYNNVYNLENHGKEWHIDHVIPISKFNLDNVDEQHIAFNWRNTMPLSCKENLAKNNKLIKEQIRSHLQKLHDYHVEKNIELPQIYIDLFAKHLDAGSSLESSLPLTLGNECEEHG